MEKRISATELAKQLSDVLNRVKYRGDEFVVEHQGEPKARIVPVGPVRCSGAELARIVLEYPVDRGFRRDIEDAAPRAPDSPWDT